MTRLNAARPRDKRVLTTSAETPRHSATSDVLSPSTSRSTNTSRMPSESVSIAYSSSSRSSPVNACRSGFPVVFAGHQRLRIREFVVVGFVSAWRRTRARDSLIAIRVNQVENCADPLNWRRCVKAFT